MPVNLVTAHKLEALPLIDYFGLQPLDDGGPASIYTNGQDIRLIISGMGKAASTAGVMRLAGVDSKERDRFAAWLNFGIAGHQNLSPGTFFSAQKIIDRTTGTAYYPPIGKHCEQLSDLISVDEPETTYPANAGYDMEGSAFFAAATSISTTELVRCCKVVSDNPDYPVSKVTRDTIRDWIGGCLAHVQSVVQELTAMAEEYNRAHALPDSYYVLQNYPGISVTQQHQLRRLAQQLQALSREPVLQELAATPPRTVDQLFAHLRLALDASI